MKTKTTTSPAFWPDELALELGDAARVERVLHGEHNVDLLTWNVFASLHRHTDGEWLAHRLRVLGGEGLRAPVRLTLWSGRTREPLLPPNPEYLNAVRDRMRQAGANDDTLAEAMRGFAAPVEAAVRIESPDVLCLVDTFLDTYPTGNRDRMLDLIDAGLDAAARVGKRLTVAAVYAAGTPAGGQVSARMRELRSPAALQAALPHRRQIPPVTLREASWQQLLQVWQAERDWLGLAGQPVKEFLARCRDLGLI